MKQKEAVRGGRVSSVSRQGASELPIFVDLSGLWIREGKKRDKLLLTNY